jgi:hypothetical protein
VVVAGLPGGAGAAKTTPAGPTFAPPVYVDQQLAGGEPEVFADTLHGTLVYSSHDGTTHLYRDGIVMSPWGDFSFVSNYCNQVNVWTSPDAGTNWYRDRYLGTQCPANPTFTGFSDPDLTQDAGGRLYNTGIDLVNDALFSSIDGGKTWDKGTPSCHDGDRPWLAGGQADQVFMGTDTVEGSRSGHQVFVSNDGGTSCSATGTDDNGALPDGGSFTGDGKLYYDRLNGTVVEPAIFERPPARDLRDRDQHASGRGLEVHAARGRARDDDVRALARDRDRLGRHGLRHVGHRRPASGHERRLRPGWRRRPRIRSCSSRRRTSGRPGRRP